MNLEYDIELKNDEISKKMDEIIEKHKKDFFVPGFRIGKAPNYIIKTRFKKELESETFQELATSKLEEIINKYKPFIYYGPALKDFKKEENEVKIKIEMEVPPEIELDYSKLSKDIPTENITEDDINIEIEKLREVNAILKPVKRKIKKGDIVLLDMELGGEKLANYSFEIGDDELSKVIGGMKKDEENEVDVEFSDGFFIEEFKGKKGRMKIRILDVKEKILPELDNEFAKTLGFDTLEDIKSNLKAELEKERKENLQDTIKNKIIQNLIEEYDVQIPEVLIKRFEMEFKDKEIAKKEAKRILLIDAIALKEKIEITEEDIDKKISEISEGKIDEDKLLQYKEELKMIMLRDKAVDFLIKEVLKK